MPILDSEARAYMNRTQPKTQDQVPIPSKDQSRNKSEPKQNAEQYKPMPTRQDPPIIPLLCTSRAPSSWRGSHRHAGANNSEQRKTARDKKEQQRTTGHDKEQRQTTSNKGKQAKKACEQDPPNPAHTHTLLRRGSISDIHSRGTSASASRSSTLCASMVRSRSPISTVGRGGTAGCSEGGSSDKAGFRARP